MVLPALLGVPIWSVLAIGADKGANDLQEGAQASPGAESIALLAMDADPTGNTMDPPIDSDNDGTPDTEQTTLGSIGTSMSVATGA
jgi:hypothetical protein